MLRYTAARFAYSFSSKPVGTQISSESAYSAILKASVYISMDFVHSPSLNTSFPSPKRFHTRSLMNTWKFKRTKSVQNAECSWFHPFIHAPLFWKNKTTGCLWFDPVIIPKPVSLNAVQVLTQEGSWKTQIKINKAYLILLLTSRKWKGWSKSKKRFMLQAYNVSAEQKQHRLEWEVSEVGLQQMISLITD